MKLNEWIETEKYLPADDLLVMVEYEESESKENYRTIAAYFSAHNDWIGNLPGGCFVTRWKLLPLFLHLEIYKTEDMNEMQAQSFIAEQAGRGDRLKVSMSNALLENRETFEDYFDAALRRSGVIKLTNSDCVKLLYAGEILKQYFSKKEADK